MSSRCWICCLRAREVRPIKDLPNKTVSPTLPCIGLRRITMGIRLKFRDLKRINEDEACLDSTIEIACSRGVWCKEEEEEERKKKLMKQLSVVQDLADGLMALADIQDGKGSFADALLVSCAGLLSAFIITGRMNNSNIVKLKEVIGENDILYIVCNIWNETLTHLWKTRKSFFKKLK
ncbi:hypothetical protein CRYUN_Cryun28dG0107700 [Craigia yunnanensis]